MTATDHLADSGWMYLHVRPAGSKRWVLKYRVGGKEKQLAMGSYPAVSLTAGPVMVHKVEMLKASRTDGDTFNAIGMEWAELEPLTGQGVYVLPGERSHDRPISDNSVLCVLYALDFGKEQTWHGLRASVRTMLADELNPGQLATEANLAHAVKDSNGRNYNRTQYLKQRHGCQRRLNSDPRRQRRRFG